MKLVKILDVEESENIRLDKDNNLIDVHSETLTGEEYLEKTKSATEKEEDIPVQKKNNDFDNRQHIPPSKDKRGILRERGGMGTLYDSFTQISISCRYCCPDICKFLQHNERTTRATSNHYVPEDHQKTRSTDELQNLFDM